MRGSMQSQVFPDVQLPVAGELAVGVAVSTWIAEGFRVVRASAIDGACASFSHNTCPHTGKSPCECLVLVLFVSRNGDGPVTVVAHGHEDATTFCLLEQTSLQRDGRLEDEPLAEGVWHVLGSLAGRN
jgi:hypothetical protein